MEKSIDELLTENSNLQDLYRDVVNKLLNVGAASRSQIVASMNEYRRKDSERIAKKREAIKEERPDTEHKNINTLYGKAVNARVLMWYYSNSGVYNEDTDDLFTEEEAKIFDAHRELCMYGLVFREESTQEYAITNKGKFLVDYWLNTPFPVETSAFKIPDRK